MLTAAQNRLHSGDFYRGPGTDYYTRRDPTKIKTRALEELESLGFAVTNKLGHPLVVT